jgi:alkanesulfonate monooxygenase SsuD/methylene tetrahydromethanopterin reductase-like flavin-dependent oxidoreductase (luciferase family)
MLRAAKYGDGWHPYYMTVETYQKSVEGVKEFAKDIGRKLPDDFGWYLYTTWQMGDTYDEALDKALKRKRYGRDLGERIKKYDILGTPKDCIERLEEFIDAGCRYFVVSQEGDWEDFMKTLAKIGKEVIPHFKNKS